ncbi:flavodoxin family protein [Clostridium celatum]|uniref:flavodoxin family protein n=1 Tax=Clostridium celatum TaxID=36834 RepID=UPI00319EB72A
MKNLVIFYSLEGNTRLIANTISKTINADILEVRTKKKYYDKGFRKYFFGGKNVLFKVKPQLEEIDKNINSYENIFIGTPIGVGTYAPAYNTFLEKYKIQNKKIALFACHGGGGALKFYNNIKEKIPNNKFIGEIDFFEPINSNKEECLEKVSKWAKSIVN